MEVHGSQWQSGLPPVQGQRPRPVEAHRGPSRVPPEHPAAQADRLALSPEALTLARALEALRRVPEVREELVEQLRAAVAAGQYQVDPGAIARAMVREGWL